LACRTMSLHFVLSVKMEGRCSTGQSPHIKCRLLQNFPSKSSAYSYYFFLIMQFTSVFFLIPWRLNGLSLYYYYYYHHHHHHSVLCSVLQCVFIRIAIELLYIFLHYFLKHSAVISLCAVC
jgi:hypothetical protein